MTSKRRESLAQATIKRVGVRKGSRVLTFSMQWWIMQHELGRPPENIEEYADWWGVSYSNGYRELRAFRAAWGDVARNPTALAALLGFDPASDSMPAPFALGVPYADERGGR